MELEHNTGSGYGCEIQLILRGLTLALIINTCLNCYKLPQEIKETVPWLPCFISAGVSLIPNLHFNCNNNS